MRVKMLKTRNFTPPEDRRVTFKYRAGQGYTVKRAWGEDMVRRGEAVEVPPPSRAEANAVREDAAPHPLDHDGDGGLGGSLPAAAGRYRRRRKTSDAEAS